MISRKDFIKNEKIKNFYKLEQRKKKFKWKLIKVL